MSVERIHEDPRVTLPYREEQWQEILRAGDAVDARLVAGDVRLTHGGEPTFVGIDSPDAPEWNTTAQGDEKRLRAEDLLRRLHARFAPSGLLFGQGKWYLGESLPRWAYGCYWRKDGEPIWQDAWLFADSTGSTSSASRGAELHPRAREAPGRARASRSRPTRPCTTCGASGACP
jgi:uncharacterized protein (DUF2126 family)